MDKGVNLRMIGKCYIRGNDLRYNEVNDSHWQYRHEVCSPNGDHFLEGMCNMGISATMTDTEVIVGAPGCYNWQGHTYTQIISININKHVWEMFYLIVWGQQRMNI